MKLLAVLLALFILPTGSRTYLKKKDDSGKIREEGWVCDAGKREGTWYFYGQDGTYESIDYVNEKRQGWYAKFTPEGGVLEIGPYYSGKKNQYWKGYYRNATTLRWEGLYNEGVKIGSWIQYDEEGRGIQVMEYGE